MFPHRKVTIELSNISETRKDTRKLIYAIPVKGIIPRLHLFCPPKSTPDQIYFPLIKN